MSIRQFPFSSSAVVARSRGYVANAEHLFETASESVVTRGVDDWIQKQGDARDGSREKPRISVKNCDLQTQQLHSTNLELVRNNTLLKYL